MRYLTRMINRFLLVLLLVCSSRWLYAQVVVDVHGAQQVAKSIVVLPLQGDATQKVDYIVSGDLKKSGFLRPINPKQVTPWPTNPQDVNYQQLAQMGINYLVMGRKLGDTSGQFVLIDVGGKKVLGNDQLSGQTSRQLAHNAADIILQHLTGVRGAFGVPIAFVLEQDGAAGRKYALMVSDYDGGNRRELFSSPQPIVSPKWSPDGHRIVFMTYANHRSQIVIVNVDTGARKVVVQSDSISSSPVFSPNGRYVAFSQSSNNNPDLFLVDLSNGRQIRLTNQPGIDTEPTFSPDGRYIYFTSDRSGTPQIYRLALQGGAVDRVVVGNGYVAASNLSPDGKSLLLTRKTGGASQVGLYDLNSKQFSILTSGRLDEGASFAPNGQMIIYATRENGRSVLKVINRKGEIVLTLNDPGGRLRMPVWGADIRK